MRLTLRTRFLLSVGLHTLLIFLFMEVMLLLYNRYEERMEPDQAEEEHEEFLILTGLMVALMPISLAGAWVVTRRLLRPIHEIIEPAERIGDGMLDERIVTPLATDELGRLAGALNRAFDRHRQAIERLRRFSFDASHQLRSPLASIRTSGETCLQKRRDAQEYEAVIGDMLEDARRLSRTVEQLLMLADAGSGLLDRLKKPFSATAVARGVAEDARAIADMRGIRLVTVWPESDLAAFGVEEMIREALANLMDNALKYTPDQGTVKLEVQAVAGPRVRLAVSDSGPGIAPGERAGIFRPFRKGDHAVAAGVGLGLAIVADIVAAHGGEAGVVDSDLGGSTFWLEIPAPAA